MLLKMEKDVNACLQAGACFIFRNIILSGQILASKIEASATTPLRSQ